MAKTKRESKRPAVDVEFWQPDNDAPLIGRVMTKRGRAFFFPGVENDAHAEPIVKDNEALSETIGSAVDAGLIVAVKAADGRIGIVKKNNKGDLIVNDGNATSTVRPSFVSRSPEMIAAADALVKSDPVLQVEASVDADAAGMVSSFDSKVSALTQAFVSGGQLFMRVIALALREVMEKHGADGLPRYHKPPERSEPLIVAAVDKRGRFVKTAHPAFCEPGTIRAALLFSELELKEAGRWNAELGLPEVVPEADE